MIFTTSVSTASLIAAHNDLTAGRHLILDQVACSLEVASLVPSKVSAFHLGGHNEVTCCWHTQRDTTANMALNMPFCPRRRRFSNTRPHLLLKSVKSGIIHIRPSFTGETEVMTHT